MSARAGEQPRAQVITVSTRAAAGTYLDTAGPAVVGLLQTAGLAVGEVVVVADGDAVSQALTNAVEAGFDLVITCGGTGISPTDQTPEQTQLVIEREVPGIADYLRAQSWDRVPGATLSRGVCGVTGASLIINVPGSQKAAIECVTALQPILGHALSQLRGGDHVRSADA